MSVVASPQVSDHFRNLQRVLISPEPSDGAVEARRGTQTTHEMVRSRHVEAPERHHQMELVHLVGPAAGEQVESVRGDREQHLEALPGAARRAGQVADQRLPPGARNTARQHPEAAAVAVARPPDRLGDARRLPVDDRPGALGREVAGAEARPAGRDDAAPRTRRSARAARPRPARRRRRHTRALDAPRNRPRRAVDERVPDLSSRVPSATPSLTVSTLARERHDDALRIARAAAAGSSAPKMPVPDTRMSTPASTARAPRCRP